MSADKIKGKVAAYQHAATLAREHADTCKEAAAGNVTPDEREFMEGGATAATHLAEMFEARAATLSARLAAPVS
jgi:hypothetical protein